MHNAEFSPREPTIEEAAEKFSNMLERLEQARQDLLRRELPDAKLSHQDEIELFRNFETRRAEKLIKELNPGSLGWFATPTTSDVSSSELDASGDLFIDTKAKQILRHELTSASSFSSSQIEIERVYSLNELGRLSVHTREIKESLISSGEPSLDDDIQEVIKSFSPKDRFQRSFPIEEEVLNDTDKELNPKEANETVDGLGKIVYALIDVYNNRTLLINEDTFMSTDDYKKYVIEEIEEYE